MSFIYGVTGGTELALIPQAVRDGHPAILLGLGLLLAGLGFKIAAFPFHMWAPDTYEAASHAVHRVAVGRAEGRGIHRHPARLHRRPRHDG